MKALWIVIFSLLIVGCSEKIEDKKKDTIGVSQGTQPADSNNTQSDTDNGSEPNEERPPIGNTSDTNDSSEPHEDFPLDPDDNTQPKQEIKQPSVPNTKNEKLRPPSLPLL